MKLEENFGKVLVKKLFHPYLFSSHLGGGVTVLGTVKGTKVVIVVSTGANVTVFSVVTQAVLSQV